MPLCGYSAQNELFEFLRSIKLFKQCDFMYFNTKFCKKKNSSLFNQQQLFVHNPLQYPPQAHNSSAEYIVSTNIKKHVNASKHLAELVNKMSC